MRNIMDLDGDGIPDGAEVTHVVTANDAENGTTTVRKAKWVNRRTMDDGSFERKRGGDPYGASVMAAAPIAAGGMESVAQGVGRRPIMEIQPNAAAAENGQAGIIPVVQPMPAEKQMGGARYGMLDETSGRSELNASRNRFNVAVAADDLNNSHDTFRQRNARRFFDEGASRSEQASRQASGERIAGMESQGRAAAGQAVASGRVAVADVNAGGRVDAAGITGRALVDSTGMTVEQRKAKEEKDYDLAQQQMARQKAIADDHNKAWKEISNINTSLRTALAGAKTKQQGEAQLQHYLDNKPFQFVPSLREYIVDNYENGVPKPGAKITAVGESMKDEYFRQLKEVQAMGSTVTSLIGGSDGDRGVVKANAQNAQNGKTASAAGAYTVGERRTINGVSYVRGPNGEWRKG